MSFFGLTQLGYQNSIQARVKNPEVVRPLGESIGRLPPIDKSRLPRPSIIPIDQVSGYGAGPQGSYVEHTRMRTKHTRNPEGIY